MGFSAGIMLSASFFSFLMPPLDAGGVMPTVVGFTLGELSLIFLIDPYRISTGL